MYTGNYVLLAKRVFFSETTFLLYVYEVRAVVTRNFQRQRTTIQREKGKNEGKRRKKGRFNKNFSHTPRVAVYTVEFYLAERI